MPSRSARPALSRRRRRLALLLGASSLLGLGATTPVEAQDGLPTDGGALGEDLFGSYQLDARGVGVQIRYEVVGVVPGGAPVLDVGAPETIAKFGSGPIGYGLAGLAYPGPLLGNLGPLIAQSGGGSEDTVPPWPIKAEAFYPTGPTEVDESQGPAVQRVTSDDLGVLAEGSFPALDAPGVVHVGSVTAATLSSIEDGLAVSRTRVTLGDVQVMGGIIAIDSVVTDLVAAHDGEVGTTNGGTTVSGLRVLGLAASLTDEGIVLDEAPPAEGPAAPLGGVLAPAVEPLAPALTPVQEAFAQLRGQVRPPVDDLLSQIGISLAVVEPFEEQLASGAATRNTSGLQLTFTYLGKEQEAMRQLLDSIPPELKPSIGPLPNPLSFLAENHITGVALAPGSVTALATPPFPPFEVPAFDLGATGSFTGGTGSVGLGAPGFSTPVAPLPTPSGGGTTPTTDGEPLSSVASGAVPAILVALALVASPLFGLGSSRLADNVLAPTGQSCPIGLDQPRAPTRPS